MPYKDKEKNKTYQREWQRKKQTSAAVQSVQSTKYFLNPDPATARQLLAILTAALDSVVTAEADPIIKARAIAYLVNVGFRGVEISSLEERLKMLEDNLNETKIAN